MPWNAPKTRNCPFEVLGSFSGLTFTGRSKSYTNADTWYPSWGDNNILYSPWTDGGFSEVVNDPIDCSSKSDDKSNAPHGYVARTGFARIKGSDPMDLRVENLGLKEASSSPYGGRYPPATLMVDGFWYYGTYCVDESGRTNSDGVRIIGIS